MKGDLEESAETRATLDRAAAGSVYGLGAAAFTWTLALVRLVLLTRLLPPELFGVATQSLILVGGAMQLLSPGLNEAILQRPEVTPGQFTTYRTLKLGFDFALLLLLALLVPAVASAWPALALSTAVLWGFLGAELLRTLGTPAAIERLRALDFRRLRAADVAASAAMTVVAPALAALGFGVWALVAEPAAAHLARFAFLGGPGRGRDRDTATARPRFDRGAAKELLRFGRTVWASANLGYLLDHFDDFWVGRKLGAVSLGLYSRAYEVATYPRRIAVAPALAVLFPVLARLHTDRPALARTFRRAAALLVRVNFAFALLVAGAAPDFVPLVFGERWLPMLLPLQLLAIYLLLDPLAKLLADLLVAAGAPGAVLRVRLAQAAIFLPAVAFGVRYGLPGVAVAANLMAAAGVVGLLLAVRRVAGVELAGLWHWPLISGAAAFGLTRIPIWEALAPSLRLFLRPAAALALFLLLLFLREREALAATLTELRARLRSARAGEPERIG